MLVCGGLEGEGKTARWWSLESYSGLGLLQLKNGYRIKLVGEFGVLWMDARALFKFVADKYTGCMPDMKSIDYETGPEQINPAELFDAEGEITELGTQKFMRINALLDELAERCGSPRDIARVMADYLIWKDNQLNRDDDYL